MKKRGILAWMAVLLWLAAPGTGTAAEGRLKFGKLSVTPGLTLEEIYNDNIYLGNGDNATDEARVDDFISHLRPGVSMSYELPARGAIGAGYAGDFAFYADRGGNDWQSHEGFFNLDYNAPGGLIAGVDLNYKDTEDPYGSENQFKLGVPKTERWTLDLRSKAGFKFSNRFTVYGFFNFFKQDYDLAQDFSQDYNWNEFGAGANLRLFSKTWGFIRYHYGQRDYDSHPAGAGVTEQNDGDFNRHRVNLGLTWDSGGKLSGELNLGYQWKDYENDVDAFGEAYEDNDTWVASTGVSYAMTPTTVLFVSLTRQLRDSGSDTREYYEDTGIGVSLRKTFFERLTVSANGAYGQNNYNRPNGDEREQENIVGGLEFDYALFDGMNVTAGWSYLGKDSNFAEDEYENNQIKIAVKAVY